MPKWTADGERQLLIFAVTEANITPGSEVWQKVADRIGSGVTAGAVSYARYFSILTVLCIK